MTELLTVWLPRAVCIAGVFALVWVGAAIVAYERRLPCSDEEGVDEGAEWDRARDRWSDEQWEVAS